MTEPLRIRSDLPLGFEVKEPLPEQFRDRPGEAPKLRSAVIMPGLNEFSGQDAEVYGLWAKANPTFVASDDAVKAGETAGLVYEVKADEPDDEYGFEPALKRASEGDNADAASDGSTVKDPGPVPAEAMRTGSPDAVAAAPVLASAAPLKVPATSEASAVAPATKAQPAAPAK